MRYLDVSLVKLGESCAVIGLDKLRSRAAESKFAVTLVMARDGYESVVPLLEFRLAIVRSNPA